MQDELNIADIAQAFFEYRANFKELITTFWYGPKQGEVIKALHKALSPWNVGLENVTWNQTAKNVAEVQLTVGVPSLLAGIQVGIGGVTMNALNPDWSRASQLVLLFQNSLEAVKESIGQDVQSQFVTWGFHVRPGIRPFKEIMRGFVNSKSLEGEDASMYGVSVYFGDYSYVIDGSAVVPGGIFIKLVRNFTADKRFEEMALTLYNDETSVLRRLGLKLQ